MVPITPAQCRAARGLLDWNQEALAQAARIGLNTLRNFEGGKSAPVANNLDAIRRALEGAGVVFIDEDGGGAGVRLRGAGVAAAPRPLRAVGPEDEARGGPEAPEPPGVQTDD